MILVSLTGSTGLDCDERESKRWSFSLSHIRNLGKHHVSHSPGLSVCCSVNWEILFLCSLK